ncbi:DUF3943 domain-containing protein [Thalassotalea sp. G20_0]|uniref:DUF3943 domain-containing protein n=1 Tax=Thalassotalea sp. G20_0 TaxID=2821093 RepID=UPI001ADA6DC6|nr:DUF3943 domain-containing protein [Thalassotalea sp. G20_0]MBO9493889.1 DUF3943 domain-containing protein [Thalassotalea sp. G20_0]
MLNQILPVFLSGLIMLSGFVQANATAPAAPSVAEPDAEFTLPLQEERSPWAITLFDDNPQENQARLWSQTKLMFGLGVGVIGALAVMPESFTNWDKSDLKQFHKKWWDNVSSGPVMDEDDFFLNYVAHPYFGGVYYIVARESGYNQWNSFVYSFLMSTFYWEYGIEAIAEVPSIQDIIVTPIGGWLYGEWAYQQKRSIVDNDGLVWGSAGLGSTALFFLDPVDSIDQWINGDREQPVVEDFDIRLAFAPTFYQVENQDEDRNYFGLVMTFRM